MKTLIKNAKVLIGDSLKEINILVEGEVIKYLGDEEPFVDTVIDGTHKVALPGLVNAHTHSPMTLLRSYADGLPLEKWLFEKIFPIEDKMVYEDIYWGSMLGILEMIASGTTAFNDMYGFVEAIFEAVSDTGIRANLCRGLLSDKTKDFESDERLKANIEDFKKYNGALGGLVTVGFGIHSVYTCTPEYLRACAYEAKRLGSMAHIHLSETETENKNCIQKYGKTPTEQMHDAGVFDLPCVAAHCVHLSNTDMKILAAKGVSAAFNPTSNLKLRSGIAKIQDMIDAGINVAIGTDGASSNNNLNMMEELHIGGILSGVKSETAFNMGTKNGVTALGYKNIGEIKEGFKADIILLDVDKPHFYPVHDMRANIIYSASGADVCSVMVNGKLLYHKRQFLTADFERIKYNAEKCKNRLLSEI